ncbi:hypothetical protein [Paenibacillus sp. P36]|uniref:hypothetical protein n=1 Tax=Paenibacillus sp. P36 TaxID=3342538 RepID=UPI0038B3F785
MEVAFIDGMNLGVGYNTATLDIHPVPVFDNVTTASELPATGQSVLFRAELASSTLSLSEQLKVSARASMKFGLFASGSVSANFVNSFKQNSYTIYVIVQTSVLNATTELDMSKIKFRPEISQQYKNDPDTFIRNFGDSFVYGVKTGGEFIGVLEIESDTTEHFNEIKTKLSGKGTSGWISGSMKASFEQTLSEIKSSYSMKATISKLGGNGIVLSKVTPDELIKEALEFPEKVAGNKGFPFGALVIPYNNIPISPLPPLDVSIQLSTLEQLGSLRQRFIKFQNDLTFAIDHPNQFANLDVKLINEQFNLISNEVSKINQTALSCIANKTSCLIPQIDMSLLTEPPKMTPTDPDNLGTRWVQEVESGNVIWIRRPGTSIFDATWKWIGDPFKAVMTVTRTGNKVTIERTHASDSNNCILTGTISDDGKTVAGKFQCDRHTNGVPHDWSATIYYD